MTSPRPRPRHHLFDKDTFVDLNAVVAVKRHHAYEDWSTLFLTTGHDLNVQRKLSEVVRVLEEAQQVGQELELELRVLTLEAMQSYCPVHRAAPGEPCTDGEEACTDRRTRGQDVSA